MRRFILAVLTSLSVAGLGACASAPTPCAQAPLAYVGADGGQLRALRFDACAGKMTMIGPVADVAKPRWAVAHPTLPIVYVAIDGSGKDGSVVAFAVDRASGALTQLNEVTAGGSGTTHLSLDVPSMTLLAANFGGGSISSIAIDRDGRLGPLVSTLKATGAGPHRRQASPHAHASAVDPSGRWALVPDMGADRVFIYGFDRASRTLAADDAADPRSFVAAAGSGPRRAVFDAGGRFVYVLDELTAQIMTLGWDAQRARLAPLQTLPLSSADFKGAKSASEIALSRDGRFVYVGDRGESMLVVYRIDAVSGLLTWVQRLPGGGDGLWHFDIHPSGRWMLVANMRSNRINLFAIDAESGRLADTGQSIESPAPVSVTFVD